MIPKDGKYRDTADYLEKARKTLDPLTRDRDNPISPGMESFYGMLWNIEDAIYNLDILSDEYRNSDADDDNWDMQADRLRELDAEVMQLWADCYSKLSGHMKLLKKSIGRMEKYFG